MGLVYASTRKYQTKYIVEKNCEKIEGIRFIQVTIIVEEAERTHLTLNQLENDVTFILKVCL